ncbi:DUF3047 domain-containing protein [Desulfogranum japonicum]|uniref:DUF3047 domain-containing protein n=1 Tax=Desulfogranum japonicum TaxID=231447 RepID=UPI0003FD090A|nr:DUF3047 domain-containing protein [Desulfogranum japonicum]
MIRDLCGFVFSCSLYTLLLLFFFTLPASSEQGDFIFEDFQTLDRWQPFLFPKIEQHSLYNIVREGEGTCLEMTTTGGASAMLLKQQFDVYEYPLLQWRWKVERIFSKGDYSTKKGDDYPARLYVMFAYDPDSASWTKQLQYGTAKLFYGEYPPDSSLNYIWANRPDSPEIITNAYVDRAKMIPVDKGTENLNQWREYQVNMVADYRKAFGSDPPRTASLAVMIDGDNTKEASRSCVDYIRIFQSN